VSKSIICKAIAIAEERDVTRDSTSSNSNVRSIVNDLRLEEQEELGLDPAVLRKLSKSTASRICRQIMSVTVSNAPVQDTSILRE
jgi:signal transduction histidine kinase